MCALSTPQNLQELFDDFWCRITIFKFAFVPSVLFLELDLDLSLLILFQYNNWVQLDKSIKLEFMIRSRNYRSINIWMWRCAES